MKNARKKLIILSLSLFIIVFSFFIGETANAALAEAVASIVGHVVQFFVWILGGILLVLMYILIWVAQYNDFVNAGAVVNGWVIVRDLCNMFFILILLVIAFATILRIESYNAKKLLPKLLIMAILINFSKTICGLILDFAQIIMLTFVNGFKNMGSGNLTNMLGIADLLQIYKEEDVAGAAGATVEAKVTFISVTGTYLLALLYTIISVIVVLVLVAVLVIRMIMLWIYVVLSPLAFLLSAFPAGQKYAAQWWSEFTKQVVVGPILAFFIWLSFVSLGASDQTAGKIMKVDMSGSSMSSASTTLVSPSPIAAGISKAGTSDNMLKFIISIGMLMGGLMITQQIGGAAGAAAGMGIRSIQKGRALAVAAGKRAAIGGAKKVGRGALGVSGAAVGAIPLDSTKKLGTFMGKWRGDLVETRDNKKKQKRLRTLNKMGIHSDNALKSLQDVSESRVGRYAKAGASIAGGLGYAATGNFIGSGMLLAGAAVPTVKAALHSRGKKKADDRNEKQDEVRADRDKKIDKARKEKNKVIDPITEIRDQDTKRAETQRDRSIAKVKERREKKQITEQEEKDQISTFEDFFENRKKVIDKDFDQEMGKGYVKTANREYESAKNKADADSAKEVSKIEKKPKSWEERKYENWHPQKITIEAAKLGSVLSVAAEKRVNSLSKGGNIHDFNKSHLYSASGLTAGQSKLYEKLGNGSETSVKALSDMVKTLEKISNHEIKPSPDQLKSIQALKQGLAAHKIGGGDMKEFEKANVINVVNQIRTGDGSHEDHDKTTEQFEETVIAHA